MLSLKDLSNDEIKKVAETMLSNKDDFSYISLEDGELYVTKTPRRYSVLVHINSIKDEYKRRFRRMPKKPH